MVINTNIAAMAATRSLAASTNSLSNSLARLSSGSKIVSPEDDAAGLAQSIRFDAQINRNLAVQSNLANAIAFSQTQDGFLIKAQSALDRMSELSVLAQDITKTNTDRSNYSVEFVQLQSYASDIGTKSFNGVSLFGDYHPVPVGYDGVNYNGNPVGKEITVDSDGNKIELNTISYNGRSLQLDGAYGNWLSQHFGINRAFHGSGYAGGAAFGYYGLDITNTTSAASALSNVQTAIQSLANLRANVGSNLQRLKFSSDQVSILNENLSTANSRIKDVDVAEETMEFARYNILVQSGTAMLSQANLLPSMALQLLG
jgi:flagellin